MRQVFKGSVTHASVPLETVDWGRFDVVAVDLYRDARIRDRFTGLLRRFLAHGRPVVITELGCCTYRGAADAGGMGWAIVDLDIAELGTRPPQLNGASVRTGLRVGDGVVGVQLADAATGDEALGAVGAQAVVPGGRGLLCRAGTARVTAPTAGSGLGNARRVGFIGW